MKEKVELYLISGFLGAGKTTFLKRMLSCLAGKRLGVLVNEFGAINVDGRVINKNGIEYREINDGSIFCSCLKASFVKTLIALQKEDIDILIIENSGLADPSNMNRLLAEMEKQMERGYDYRGSVCLVDCTTFMDYLDVLTSVENQILASNCIIVNKTDLVSKEEAGRVTDAVKQINCKATILEAVQADVPAQHIMDALAGNGYDGETSNRCDTRPQTYAVTFHTVYPIEAVEKTIRLLSRNTLRVKGFIETAAGWYHADAVGEYCSLNSIDFEPGMQAGLVIIGKGNTPFEDIVLKIWKDNLHDTPVVEED